mgnify:FL=1|jgi:hypothetical protein
MSYTSIPLKQTSNFFGIINKVIWFDVEDIKGNFNVNLYITPNQRYDMNVVIFNKGSNEEMYRKTYNKSSVFSTITDNVKIMHVPGQRTATYGIKSF